MHGTTVPEHKASRGTLDEALYTALFEKPIHVRLLELEPITLIGFVFVEFEMLGKLTMEKMAAF